MLPCARAVFANLWGPLLRCVNLCVYLCAVAAAAALPANGERAQAGELCPKGWFADVMVGSYHVHPYRHFDDFNPGAGVECALTPQWEAAFGYFRNSLDRPSFYGGAIYTPEFAHWSWFRLGLMGGIISGYNYGQIGLGRDNRTGPVLAPTAISQFGRFGVNLILIPPIPSDHLPFTLGFQVKFRIR
jgi:hypothetical protein